MKYPYLLIRHGRIQWIFNHQKNKTQRLMNYFLSLPLLICDRIVLSSRVESSSLYTLRKISSRHDWVSFLLRLMIWCVMTKHKFHSGVADRYSILIINLSRNPHENCVLCNTLLTSAVTSATFMAGRPNSDVGVRCTWQRCTHCSHLINAGLLVYHWCVRNTGTTFFQFHWTARRWYKK